MSMLMRKRAVETTTSTSHLLEYERVLARICCFVMAMRTSFSSGCTINVKTATLCAFPTVGQVAPWL